MLEEYMAASLTLTGRDGPGADVVTYDDCVAENPAP